MITLKGNRTWPDYLVDRDDKKLRGHSRTKTAQKSSNSCEVNGGIVGAHGQLTWGSNGLSPGTKLKRSKNVFNGTSIPFTDVHLCTELLQLPAQSIIGSPGTLVARSNLLVEKSLDFPNSPQNSNGEEVSSEFEW